MAGRPRRAATVFAGVLGVSWLLAGCGADAEQASAPPPASCTRFEEYGTFDTATVTIASSIVDTEADRFRASFETFERCTGITITWQGSGGFETDLPERVAAGKAPDLAAIPQPGLLATLVRSGAVKPASEAVAANARQAYSGDWVSYGTVDGRFYAPPLGANVKSFVWYSPSMFAANGWAVPTTWAQLETLTETIASSGVTPWCAGIGSQKATGWPATDWLEDVLLRTAGPGVYDQWVAHTIPFDDERVAAALDEVGGILRNDRYVNGGYGDATSIGQVAFQDGGLPILEGQCALHRQASFYASQWPERTVIGEDGDVFAFYLPGNGRDRPVLGGGEFLAAFNDLPQTQAVQLYLGSADWNNAKAALGDWISAHEGLDVANVVTAEGEPNPINVLSVQTLQADGAVFRFDGSDLMPAAVGAGTFWKGMVDWINGAPTAKVLRTIEESWPS